MKLKRTAVLFIILVSVTLLYVEFNLVGGKRNMSINIYDDKVLGEKLDHTWNNAVQDALGAINAVGSYPVLPVQYHMFKVGAVYYGRNGLTGKIDQVNASSITVFQAILDSLGEIGGGVSLAPNMNITGNPVMKSYTQIIGSGETTYIVGTLSVDTGATRHNNMISNLKIDRIEMDDCDTSIFQNLHVTERFYGNGAFRDNTLINVGQKTGDHAELQLNAVGAQYPNANYIIGGGFETVITEGSCKWLGGNYGYLGSGTCFTVLWKNNLFLGVRVESMDVGWDFQVGAYNTVFQPVFASVPTQFQGNVEDQHLTLPGRSRHMLNRMFYDITGYNVAAPNTAYVEPSTLLRSKIDFNKLYPKSFRVIVTAQGDEGGASKGVEVWDLTNSVQLCEFVWDGAALMAAGEGVWSPTNVYFEEMLLTVRVKASSATEDIDLYSVDLQIQYD